jgi:uncharacterized damage-inducible protein DinB
MDLSVQLFDYDAWASREWQRFLDACPTSSEGEPVFQHISEWLANWQDRVPVEPKPSEGLYEFWKRTAQETDLGATLQWKRKRTGQHLRNTVGDVLNHVVTHGTYHRGHLRGLAELHGWGEFPETDFIRYAAKPETAMLSGGHSAHLDLFAHDAWGWRQWQRVEAEPFGDLAAKREALAKHHAGCCRGWGGGTADVLGISDPEEPGENAYDIIETWLGWWNDTVSEHGPEKTLEYPNRSGTMTISLGQIAVHVANHGSYHRGQLRALAEAAGMPDWPDTDFIFFSAKKV